MPQFGLDPANPADDLMPNLDLMEESILELVRISLATGTRTPPQLNFVISDGRHLVASRWGNSLYWVFRNGVSDCSVCGTSHCPKAEDGYRAVAVASEPISAEDRIEIPKARCSAADDITTVTRSLVGALSATAGL